jgi:hypothetical protein
MDGFPRDQIETVMRLKELCICRYNIRILITFANAVTAQAQAIYRLEFPYTGRYDILQCSRSGTFVAHVIIYSEEDTGKVWKCLSTGQSATCVVNALENLWTELQIEINLKVQGGV